MAGLRRALLLCAGLLAALPLRAELDRSSLVRIGSSVLKIEARREQGGYSLGSGVVVGADRVVTNCHVTQGARDIFVLRGDVRWRVLAQASDPAHDLCLLRVRGIGAASVPLGRSASLKPRQAVTAVGYTGGLGIQSSAGEVVALHKLDGGRVVQSTNWFTSGASGGGLFDDDMRLVGVLTFRLRGGENHYFAAPVEWLAPLLADSVVFRPVGPAEPAAWHDPAYWQRAATEQPNFLQAIALERDHKWAELEALALSWTRSDGDDAEPWALQGFALDRLGRVSEAQRAFEKALSIDPDHGDAWYRLGLLWLRQGALDRARQARRQLETIDPDRARELEAAIGKT